MKKIFVALLLAVFTLVLTAPAMAEIKFSGDARYRLQGLYTEGQQDDNSQKFRLRLKAEAMPNEHITLAARMVTGTGSSTSTNVEMGNYAAPKNLFLDQMYMQYAPFAQLSFTGGKFAVPMRYTDMVFDPDLNLDGTYAHLNTKYVFGNFGGYWVMHNSAFPDYNQALFMYQLGFTVPYFEPAVGYYDYTHLTFPYKVLDANISVPFKYVTVYGNYIRNTAISEENDGYLAGLKTKFKWLNFDYNYRDRKVSATYNPFVDDDFGNANPAVKGHRINLWTSPYQNTKAGVTYMMANVDPSTTNTKTNRLLVDFEVQF